MLSRRGFLKLAAAAPLACLEPWRPAARPILTVDALIAVLQATWAREIAEDYFRPNPLHALLKLYHPEAWRGVSGITDW